ncbi:MAG: TerB N-terminal domain-containing protein [Desulforhopalus sp.]
MKKSEAKGTGILIIFAIIASPFIWLYEKIGGVGILIIAVVGVGIYVLSKSGKSKDKVPEVGSGKVDGNREQSLQNRFEDIPNHTVNKDENDYLPSFTITVKTSGSSYYGRARSTNKEPGRWAPLNESVSVGKYRISKGLIYVGGVLKGLDDYSTESSLIDPTLPIDDLNPDYSGDEMGYWPTYLDINASSRAAYLEWLAGSRDNPDDYIGFVFLYFYGLERRLLVDKAEGKVSNQEMQVLFNEVKRLLNVYGKNRSFKNYSLNLISHVWILNGAKGTVSDEFLIFNNYFSPIFQYLLARTVNEEKPVPPNLAFAWVKGNPEFRLRTPARRCASEFRNLFEKRYKEAFQPDGLFIKPNKTKLSISYTPASSSLRGYEPVKFDLPDPTRLKSQAKKLCELAEKCTDDLNPYSRFLGRKGNSRESVSAIAQLPADLINHLKIDKIEVLKKYLKDRTSEHYSNISVASLLKVINEENLFKLNKKECETIAFLLDATGFGLAPDIRYHGAKLEANGSLIVFAGGHGLNFEPSVNFKAVGAILRLGAMVAKIDGEVSSPEVELLEEIIENDDKLRDLEKKSLKAYLHWRLVEPANAKGLKDQLSGLKSEEKSAISNILINVAYADGYVDPVEVRQLEKLYTSLGLEKESVAKDIHNISAQREPSAVNSAQDAKANINTNRGAFIDMDLLRRHEAETEGVKAILGEIFTESDTEENVQNTTLSSEENSLSGGVIAELDEAHQTLFQKLIKKEEWAREEIQSICEHISLMIDGSIETINDWAFEHVDAPLIEEGELIYVDLELADEISNINA